MKIKKLTARDAVEYQDLILRAVSLQPESFRLSPNDVQRSKPPFVVENVDDFTLGAFANDKILIGMVSFKREETEKMRHKGLIYRMYVALEYAGQGIGRKLLRAALQQAEKISGLEQINLTVIASNERARRLYESEGFVSFSHEKRALKIGADYFDEVTLAFQLNQSPKQE